MTNPKEAKRQSARVALLNQDANPNQERITKIKQWHIDQAIADTKPVATLNITVTAAGTIVTQGVCIEKEHAQAMLVELQAVIRRIQSQIITEDQPALQLVRRA